MVCKCLEIPLAEDPGMVETDVAPGIISLPLSPLVSSKNREPELLKLTDGSMDDNGFLRKVEVLGGFRRYDNVPGP